MDDRLKKALEFANYRTTLFNRKQDIKLKVDAMLKHSINGGTFKITQELINFTKLLLDDGREFAVMIDSNGNPIKIEQLQTFYNDIFSRYFEATNLYHVEYTKLKNARSVADILRIDDK